MLECNDDIDKILSTLTKETTKRSNFNSIKNNKQSTEENILSIFNPKNEKEKSGDYIGNKTYSMEIDQNFEEDQKLSLDEYFENNNIDKIARINSNKKTKNKKEEINNINLNNINKKEEQLKSNNEININNDTRKDNLRKEIMKKPVNIVKKVAEKIGKIKLNINLNDVFGTNYEQNKATLDLKIYEILCLNKDNIKKLEEVKLNPEEEKIFNYLLTRTYEFIYENYLNNNRIFKIGKNLVEIKELKTFNDIINKRRNKTKKIKVKDEYGNVKEIEKEIKYNENEMNEFIGTSKEYFKQLRNGFFDKRKQKNNKIFIVVKSIARFEDYIKNEKMDN